jgi:hypothetical protein
LSTRRKPHTCHKFRAVTTIEADETTQTRQTASSDFLVKKNKRQRHRANAPVKNIEDHYHVLNSRFPQELKAIFYGNYLVPALVNNVNQEIVNDMKTEYMNDLPYPNNFP